MDLKINEKISPTQIRQLIKYSNFDELIIKTTSDRKRFNDHASVDEWLKKKRKTYTLVDEENKLMGIIWFGKKIIPTGNKKYIFTFAVRLYKSARGIGYAKVFMKDAINKYKETDEYKKSKEKGFWLVTDENNLAAIKAYKHFGFKAIPYNRKQGRILMVTDKI